MGPRVVNRGVFRRAVSCGHPGAHMSIESAEPAAPSVRTQPVAPTAAAIEPDELRAVEMFADLRPDEIAWIAAHCERIVLTPGQLLLVSGQPPEWMFIGLRGTIEVRRQQLGASVPAYVFHAGDVAGVIPYSRMKEFVGNGRIDDEDVERARRCLDQIGHRIAAMGQR